MGYLFKGRRLTLGFGALVAAMGLDVWLVVYPVSRGARPFVYWVTTLGGPLHANYGSLMRDVAVAEEDGKYRLLYGEEAKAYFPNGPDPIWVHVRPPFVQEHGLITPFYAKCVYELDADVPAADLAKLRSEYVAYLLADPRLAELSHISRAALAAPGTTVSEISWPLLIHDMLFVGAVPAVIFAGLVTCLRRRFISRRIRHGLCRTCGYDLAGLTAAGCPECGNANTSLHPPR